ncbi:MAG: DNA methyltransferase [Chloroflexota bacterium]
MPEHAQLPLPLEPADLPALSLPADWKEQPRSFGHAFHPLCTYLGGLPPAMAHALIERFSRPGDVVLDPFCGRGTVPLQATLRRRIGVGVDLNPLAALLSGAVLDPPSHREAQDRLTRLRIAWTLEQDRWFDEALELQTASAVAPSLFHPETLAELLFLRRALDRRDRTDRFLLAALAGILHGSRASHLTDAMPNAFSMAPRYTRTWLDDRAAARPRRDVFVLLGVRLRRLFRDGLPVTRGIAIAGDARHAADPVVAALNARALPDRVRLVVTSPPYLRVVRYGLANWLRLWLLGEDAARVDALLSAPASEAASAALLTEVLTDLRPILAPDAVVVLVLGDVESDRGKRLAHPASLARSAWELAAAPAGYELAGIADDRVDPERKLTRIWGMEAGRATRTDRLLVIAPTAAGVARARASASLPVDWAPADHGGLVGRPLDRMPDMPVVRPGDADARASIARGTTGPGTLGAGTLRRP